MFNPKYRILLTSECFPHDNVVCLGTQLILIISLVKDLLPQHMWYGADVDAVGRGIKKYNLKNIQPKLIGNDSQFIEYCSGIGQFIWGEFLCVDASLLSETIQNIELETEDAPFRPLACDGILIEIRTFDTSFFEMYSEDIELMKKLSQQYKVAIERPET